MKRKNILWLIVLLIAGGLLGTVAMRFGTGDPSRSERNLIRNGKTFRTEFSRMHETSVEGRAKVRPVQGGFVITVKLRGLKPGKQYNTHYHQGTCHQPGGGGIQLNPLRADGTGKAMNTTRVDYEAINPTFDHLVMVHNPNQHHILCANAPRVKRLKSLTTNSDSNDH